MYKIKPFNYYLNKSVVNCLYPLTTILMLNVKSLCIFLCIGFNLSVFSQGNFELKNGVSDKIHFKLVNNLIVIPVTINGVSLSFLLDTGVSKPILFNFFNLKEELSIHETELILIHGLGNYEPIEALRSSNNTVIIGEAVNLNQDLFAIIDASINFVPSLGIPVHGIIGYDIFKDFVVEINYSRKFIKLYNPLLYDSKLSRKWRKLDLIFYNKKPIIEASVTVDHKAVPVNLLIDTGGSDSLWLFEDPAQSLSIPKNTFDDFLGKGLSGAIFGKRSVLKSFRLKDFQLNKVNVAFPDSSSIQKAKINTLRNGSLLGDVLHRFNWVFNYKSQWAAFKKNKFFNKPFKYNKSGIVMQYAGVRLLKTRAILPSKIVGSTADNTTQSSSTINFTSTYKFEIVPELEISDIRPNSPADEAGLKIGDIVLSINNQSLSSLTLQKAIDQFYGADGKRIKMTIERAGVSMKYQFNLRDLLHKKSTH